MKQVLRESNGMRLWRSVTFNVVRSGQPRPYADSVTELEVTFTGASRSSFPDKEIPFATMPPFCREDWEDRPGRKIFFHGTIEDKERQHNERIKSVVRALYPWQTDSTVGENRTMGGSWLQTFEHVRRDDWSNTYRFVIVTPYMD